MNAPLSAQHVLALRQSAHPAVAVEVVAETGSTNADLLARLDGLTMPLLLAAEAQTAGRGRAGREWHAAPGAALTFSLAWRFRRPLAALAGLPLAVGVALAESLAAFGIEAQLKWPNDVLKDGRKLAGVLIETGPAAAGAAQAWAVIGIGLNLKIDAGLAARIGRPAADLSTMPVDRNHLLAALLDGLAAALPEFDAAGFGPFVARWNRLHAYAGRLVRIIDHGKTLHEGYALGVDEGGQLLLQTAAGGVAVMAGDVSLRAEET